MREGEGINGVMCKALSVTCFHYHLTNKMEFPSLLGWRAKMPGKRQTAIPRKEISGSSFISLSHTKTTSLLPHILIIASDTLRTSIYHFISSTRTGRSSISNIGIITQTLFFSVFPLGGLRFSVSAPRSQ